MKVHIGSGTVYLLDWLNVDVHGPNTHLAYARPDLVGKYATDESDYYARHKDKTVDTFRQGAKSVEYICDVFGSFLDLPVADAQADEILARQAFEHLSVTEAKRALREMHRALKPDGVLRLDVPDTEETLRLLMETRDKFYIRHLLGPRTGDYGYHMMSWTRLGLNEFVSSHGFRFVGTEPNIHNYPAFTLRWTKRGTQVR